MKTLKRPIDLDINDYVNKRTGELLSSEIQSGTALKVLQETNLVEMHSEEYVTFDSASMAYIRENNILSKTDLGYVHELSDTLKTGYNALHRTNNHLHTIDSISTYLDLSYEKARALVNRLIKKSILYKLTGVRGDMPFKAFIMNPYIARKRKYVFNECAALFQQFREARDLYWDHKDVPVTRHEPKEMKY